MTSGWGLSEPIPTNVIPIQRSGREEDMVGIMCFCLCIIDIKSKRVASSYILRVERGVMSTEMFLLLMGEGLGCSRPPTDLSLPCRMFPHMTIQPIFS